MDWKMFFTVFGAIFLAELADKTQLATVLFAADRAVSKWLVFAGAASALVAASAVAVLAGHALSSVLNPRLLSVIAGTGFIAIGAWVLMSGLRAN